MLAFFILFPPYLLFIKTLEDLQTKDAFDISSIHNEEVNKRRQKSRPSLAASLPLGVSFPPAGRLSAHKFNFPCEPRHC
jgi:hypothetical protein